MIRRLRNSKNIQKRKKKTSSRAISSQITPDNNNGIISCTKARNSDISNVVTSFEILGWPYHISDLIGCGLFTCERMGGDFDSQYFLKIMS